MTASRNERGNESMAKRGCGNCLWWKRLDDPRARDVNEYGKCNWPVPPIIDPIEAALISAGLGIEKYDLNTPEYHSCSGYEAVEDAAP